MKNSKIKDLLKAFARILQSVLIASYLGPYRYYTLEPIENIKRNQKEILGGELTALKEFRHTKDEELSFVAKAAALSGAAAIGVFSWPTTEKTVWAAKMFWNWSFCMSTFSLIGSAPTRLLQHLPGKDDEEYKYNKHNIEMALNLFLQLRAKDDNASGKMNRQISRRMLWVWQCPAMLMSYSWVLFLAGFALHVLSPVFDPSQAEVSSKIAIVTIFGCVLLFLNFAFCAGMCQYRLQDETLLKCIRDLLSGKRNTHAEMKDCDPTRSETPQRAADVKRSNSENC